MATAISTGSTIQTSEIYKCTSCKNEITCVKCDRVPPCKNCNNTSFTLARATNKYYTNTQTSKFVWVF